MINNNGLNISKALNDAKKSNIRFIKLYIDNTKM